MEKVTRDPKSNSTHKKEKLFLKHQLLNNSVSADVNNFQ